jgi:hypothetical protein
MIQVVPYTYWDGIWTFRDSEMIDIFHRIIRDSNGYIFRDGTTESQFLKVAKGNLCAIAQDGNELAGVGWLTDIEYKKAVGHFVVFREFWGKRSAEVTKTLTNYFLTIPCEDGFFLDAIWGFTDVTNRLALRHIAKIGFVIVGEIPCGVWHEKAKSADPAVISYITREQVVENG